MIQNNNLKSRGIMIPVTNRCKPNQSAIPERFNTISVPVQISIVTPELSSISIPRPSEKVEQIP